MKQSVLVGLLVAGSALMHGPAGAQTIERAPYLHQLGPDSVIVVWTTSSASASVVKYGASPTALSQSASAPDGTQHEVKISGLSPDTRYYYSVGTAGTVLAGGDMEHYFRTAPPPGTQQKFRAWVVGDSGTGGLAQREVRDAMLNLVGDYRPQLYLHMGDMAYSNGTTNEFTNNFFAQYAGVLAHTVIWPTMGNHEGSSSDSGAQTGPYYSAYVLPKAGEIGGLPSGTEAYYSFDYANVHFIVLDSHDSPRDPAGAMLTWMKNDLMATNQEWVIAYWHHPAYTKGSHDSDTEGQLIDMRENALPILEAGGVDLVLAGHSHIYERSYLVDGAYATPTTAAGHIQDNGNGKADGDGPYQKQAGLTAHAGAVYVVAGHGGAGVSGPANHPLMYFSETRNGSCILDVQANRLSLINVRADGQVSDRFAMIKGSGIVVARPDGGERLSSGMPTEIRWASVGNIANVKIEYSLDDGANWSVIADSAPNNGSYMWTVPAVSTTHGLIKVSDASQASTFDESNAGFIITAAAPVKVISYGDVWKYDDGDVDHMRDWLYSDFDDASWKSGAGQLGYGDGDEATLLSDQDPNVPSAYFRRTINLSGEVSEASLSVIHDDGVSVWVNGTLVMEKYMQNGTQHSAFASQTAQDNELSESPISLTTNPFVVGDNVIAVMVKQADASSSDLSFDMELTLTVEPVAPDGGTGTGGAGSGGTASGGTGNDSAGGAQGSNGGSSDDSGCGCRTAAGSGSPLALLGLSLLSVWYWRRRGQRRS